jgi:hypothetical protein
MTKIDFKRELKHLYAPSRGVFTTVEVPDMQFLMVDGAGDPNSAQRYQDAVSALYAVAYKLKFMSKRTLERDYVVPPLEGLWWMPGLDGLAKADSVEAWLAAFAASDRDMWQWTMMIMQPDWITPEMVAEAHESALEDEDTRTMQAMRLAVFQEGMAVQTLHVGPYAAEGPLLADLHVNVLPAQGLREAGKHHEIYLSDPRRVAPEKLKTVLRQPVQPFE